MVDGLKFDQGKEPLRLLPWKALRSVAQVLEHGAQKYAVNNWQHVRPGHRYLDAALRHLADYAEGQDNDQDSGLPTLAHAACDILFMLWLELHGVSCRDTVEKKQE